MTKMAVTLFLYMLVLSCCYVCEAQSTTDTIKPGQTLKYSDKMLVSADGKFQLGFFNVSYSRSEFLGIRYATESLTKWVWVANREVPLYNTSGASLAMDENGLLEIITSGENNNNSSIFQLNPNRTSPESITVLENSGNLVVKESNPDVTLWRILWESLDNPTDTLLPGMKLGGGKNGPVLVSWLSESSPGPGLFTLDYDPQSNKAEPFVVKRRGNLYTRYGKNLVEDWVKARLSFVENGTESYFSFSSRNASGLSLRLNPDGRVTHGDSSGSSTRISDCDGGVNYPSSCAARPGLGECRAGEEDVFVARHVTILSNSSPSSQYIEDDQTIVQSDCLDRCWRNCTCIGFEALYADGTGCRFWNQEARFADTGFFGDFLLLNSTYNKQKSISRCKGSGMRWWIWVIVLSVAFRL